MKQPVAVTLATLALLVLVPWAIAQTGGGYNLTWSTIDGGGHTFSSGGGYHLGGTIGQLDAGLLAGDGYSLGGGFWGGGELIVQHNTYLPLVVRQFP